MPKPVLNNRINKINVYGRVIAHDTFLNQGVRSSDSPTFSSLFISGDTNISGNLYVEGNTTLLNSNVIQFEDNIIVINSNETGDGVSLNLAGIEIKRGLKESYRIVYNETDQALRAGILSNTQAVSMREDSPLTNGIMIWNESEKRTDAVNTISLPTVNFTSTLDSHSSTSGAISISGGVGIEKNVHVNGKVFLANSAIYTESTSNTFVISSSENILLNPRTDILIPFSIPLSFGNSGNSITASSSNNLNISSNGDINFSFLSSGNIVVPKLSSIIFSTSTEKIFANSSNDLVISSSADIHLQPTSQVLIPVNIPITFGNSSQSIQTNSSNELIITADSNVRIPVDVPLLFGNTSGTQGLSSTLHNDLNIFASRDINLLATGNINIDSSSSLTFGGIGQSLQFGTTGSINVIGSLLLSDTTTSQSASSGAIVVNGGVGIIENLHVGQHVVINGNLSVLGSVSTFNTQTVLVEDNLIVVNSAPSGLSDGGFLVKKFSDNTFAGVVFRESQNEFVFAVSDTDPSSSTISTQEYIPIRSYTVSIESTSPSSLSVNGGGYIAKSLTVDLNAHINDTLFAKNAVITNTSVITSITSGALVVHGGIGISQDVYIGKDLFVSGPSFRVPVGTTLERPVVPTVGYIRYNNEKHQFEGYGETAWRSLNGITDDNNDTTILAEIYPGSNDDTLRFITAGKEAMCINSNGNIGVQTTSPQFTFDVHGDLHFSGELYQDGQVYTGTTVGNVRGNSVTINSTSIEFSGAFNADNNVSIPSDITGLIFTNTRSFVLTLALVVSTSHKLFSQIIIEGIWKDDSWELFTSTLGDNTDIIFSITQSGQLQYTSPDFSSWSSTLMRYNAKILNTGVIFEPVVPTVGNYNFPYDVIVSSTSDSVSSETGALWVAGGLGVSKHLYVGEGFVSQMNSIGNLFTSTTGNIGIGDTAPQSLLSVAGKISCESLSAPGTNTVGNIFTVNGNVGIGDSSPAHRLSVDGDVFVDQTIICFGIDSQSSNNTLGNLFTSTNGNIGIGTSNPEYTLDIIGSINATGTFYVNGSEFGISSSPWTLSENNVFYTSGNVGIGTTSPTATLDVRGDIYTTGEVRMISDIQAKTNITTIPNALQKLSQIRGVYYNKIVDGKTDTTTHMGVIADEIQETLPEVVYEYNGSKSVAYSNVIGILIQAINELQFSFAELKSLSS